ncbi:MAG: insulinase family protein [Candidatus Aminicenantes bacterium]|nr:MAG: insulinase family protein [Candidatus Aminicenantes bacterium]
MKTKKWTIIFLFIVIVAFIIGGCGKKETTPPADTRQQEGEKTGQVKIIPLKIENEPIVAFKFVFHTGSMDDPEGKNGLAYLTAQMLAKGGTQTNSFQTILEKLFPMASTYRVRVDREYTTFYGETHKDNSRGFYNLFKEALLEPGFRSDDFQRLQAENINFIKNRLRYDDNEELGKAVFKAFVYRGTRYENNVRGKVADLEKITLEEVKGFYNSHFSRDKLIVGISGNFPDSLVEQINSDFSQLPAGTVSPGKPVVPGAIKGLQVLIVEKPGDSTGIHIGFPIKIMRKDPGFHALFLANSWLGEHRHAASHLYQVIRERRGMNYGDYSYIEDFPEGGLWQFPPTNIYKNPQLFEIWIRPVENDKREFALRAALRELKKLVDKGMKKEDFELTKQFLSKYYLHFASSTAQRLGYKIDDHIFALKESYLENFKKHIRSLTLDQVNQAIKTHLQYENLKIVFVTSDAEKLKNLLVNNAPSPIKYRTPKPEEIMAEDKLIEVFPLKVLPENVEIINIEQVFQ